MMFVIFSRCQLIWNTSKYFFLDISEHNVQLLCAPILYIFWNSYLHIKGASKCSLLMMLGSKSHNST